MTQIFRVVSVAALLAAATTVHAGCGSAFCSLISIWSTQGAWSEPGGRFDLRYEFIDQDQPRSGTGAVDVGEIHRHHDEVRTINRNYSAGFDYTFDSNWGVGVQLPIVDRSHEHIHIHMGTQIPEAWSLRRGVDFGAAYPLAASVALQLQLNPLWKDRDAGENAEPEDTGGTFVHLSPGVSVALGDKTQLYGFVQVPIYQYVNGVQLTADWSVAAGLSHRL